MTTVNNCIFIESLRPVDCILFNSLEAAQINVSLNSQHHITYAFIQKYSMTNDESTIISLAYLTRKF